MLKRESESVMTTLIKRRERDRGREDSETERGKHHESISVLRPKESARNTGRKLAVENPAKNLRHPATVSTIELRERQSRQISGPTVRQNSRLVALKY